MIFLSPLSCYAKEPWGAYKVIYTTYKLGEKTALQPINVHITIEKDKIIAQNTNTGDKVWNVEYRGTWNDPNFNGYTFHVFYLTTHKVFFRISDKLIFQLENNQKGYIINFDGKIQIAI